MTRNAFPCGRVLPPALSRRQMLQRAGIGFGSLALNLLLADEQRVLADQKGVLDTRKLTGKAKNVIFLYMSGGPSQVDTFDPKPELAKLNGKDVPESIAKGIPRIARSPLNNLYASPYRFSPCGKSGLPVSSLFPELGKQADHLCVLRSLPTQQPYSRAGRVHHDHRKPGGGSAEPRCLDDLWAG